MLSRQVFVQFARKKTRPLREGGRGAEFTSSENLKLVWGLGERCAEGFTTRPNSTPFIFHTLHFLFFVSFVQIFMIAFFYKKIFFIFLCFVSSFNFLHFSFMCFCNLWFFSHFFKNFLSFLVRLFSCNSLNFLHFLFLHVFVHAGEGKPNPRRQTSDVVPGGSFSR